MLHGYLIELVHVAMSTADVLHDSFELGVVEVLPHKPHEEATVHLLGEEGMLVGHRPHGAVVLKLVVPHVGQKLCEEKNEQTKPGHMFWEVITARLGHANDYKPIIQWMPRRR